MNPGSEVGRYSKWENPMAPVNLATPNSIHPLSGVIPGPTPGAARAEIAFEWPCRGRVGPGLNPGSEVGRCSKRGNLMAPVNLTTPKLHSLTPRIYSGASPRVARNPEITARSVTRTGWPRNESGE